MNRLWWIVGLLFVGAVFVDAAGIGFLSDVQSPLSPEQRETVVHEALANGQWTSLAQSMVAPLVKEASSLAPDQPAWNDRLHLARVMFWLDEPETTSAARYLISMRHESDAAPATSESYRRLVLSPQFQEHVEALFGSPAHAPHDDKLAARLKPETLTALLSNSALVNLLSTTVTEDDYLPGVFQVLGDLQEHAPAMVADYPALAVALAVVDDAGPRSRWPHGQVAQEKVPLRRGNWCELFDYFTKEDQNHKLVTDLRSLRPDVLKYLVDVPLELSELQWARDHIRKSRPSFNEVFFQVKYDMRRYDAKELVWPGPDYRLESILKTGGICVDQAYFAWIAGKARGLPTILFSGQGRDGGHAWFGYLKTDEKWDMDAGRYESQQFVTGIAHDPQNGQPINDHQLAFISNRVTTTEDYQRSNALLLLAQLSSGLEDKDRLGLLELARSTCSRHLGVWQAQTKYIEQTGDRVALREQLAAMMEQFKDEADLKAPLQQKLLVLAEASKDSDSVSNLKQEMTAPGRNRSDLAIKAAAASLQEKLASQDYDGAVQEYRAAIRKFSGDGGGNLFYGLIRPFVLKLHELGRKDEASQCLQFAEDKLHFAPNSLIALEDDKVRVTLGLPRKYVQPTTPG